MDHDPDHPTWPDTDENSIEPRAAAIAALRQAVEAYEQSLADMHAVATRSDDDVLPSPKVWQLAHLLEPLDAIQAAERASHERNRRTEHDRPATEAPPPDVSQ